MAATERQEAYWKKSYRLTAILLAIWFFVTFFSVWYADALNKIVVLGFPLGFYMAAQGALVVYLLIIWYYGRSMNRQDSAFGVVETDDE